MSGGPHDAENTLAPFDEIAVISCVRHNAASWTVSKSCQPDAN